VSSVSSVSSALATGIIYDGFDYDATNNPPLGSGPSAVAGAFGKWIYQGNNVVEPRIYGGSLSYTGLPTSIGNKVQLDNNNGLATGADGSRLYLGTLDKASVPTLYYSFVTSIPSSTNTNQNGAFFAGFDNLTAGTAYSTFAGLFVRQNAGDTSNVDLGISTSGSANKAWVSNLPEDTPLFVVASFTFQGLSTLDVFTDPTAIPFAEPGTHAAVSGSPDASPATTVTNFYLRGNLGQPQAIKVDELRIGTSFADVAAHQLYWDANGATAGSGGTAPTGDWDGTTANFNTDATGGDAGTIVAAPSAFDSVSFSAANEGTGAYTVNVAGTQSTGTVQVNVGDVTFANGTLAVGRFDVATGAGATVSSSMAGGPTGVTKAGAGTLTIAGASTYTGETRVVAGTLALANNLTSSSAVIVTGGTLELTAGGGSSRVIKTGAVSITGSGRIDLGDNKLITTTVPGTANASGIYNGLQGMVQSAYNFGAWDMPGLTTSQENAGQNAGPLSGTTTIGVATAEQVLFIGPTDTALFMGQTVTGAMTIAMYTYAGDVNFDGLVDGADYGTLDNWIQFPGTDGYANGDVNYDGIIDGADYGVLDNTIQLQGAPLPGVNGASAQVGAVSAVPEPASLLAAAAVGAGVFAARRRRRR